METMDEVFLSKCCWEENTMKHNEIMPFNKMLLSSKGIFSVWYDHEK